MKRYINYIAAFLISMLYSPCLMKAQDQKTVTVAYGKSYAESISLKQDARDMDMILKIIFDEPSNSLTVSLMSYRNLFVFQDQVRYRQVVRRSRLKPDLFPYVLSSDPETSYKLTGELKDQMPGCNKKFVFNRWLEYEGLRPQPTDYKMVNDYIEQKFDIVDMDTVAFISLHDVLVMEPSQKKKNRYDMLYLARLDRKYRIRIERNPCLGKSEDIEAARASAEAIRIGYENLYQRYMSEERRTEESIQVLGEMRDLLEQQFPRRTDTHSCPVIMEYISEYNGYVDSIEYLKDIHLAIKNERLAMPLPAERIMSIAKIIDRNVMRWILSADNVEKEDLITRCQTLLDEVNQYLDMDVTLSEEQQRAVRIFIKAERYFEATCCSKKK
jgi:hypothetical protein